MLNKINKMVAVVFFAAIGMVTAPTLATVSMVYGASFNPFKDIPGLKNLNLPIDKEKFNFDLPDTGSSNSGGSGGSGSGGSSGGSGGSSGGSGSGDTGSSGGSSGGSGGDTCKVDNSQKGTHFYCFTTSGKNTHHHCDPKDPVNVKSGLCKKT
jgi:hypothetical protein